MHIGLKITNCNYTGNFHKGGGGGGVVVFRDVSGNHAAVAKQTQPEVERLALRPFKQLVEK